MKFVCPKCKRAELTLADRLCPNPECAFPFTLQAVAGHYWRGVTSLRRKVITAPIQGVYHRHFDQPTPEFVKRLQRVYFLLSVTLLFVMLSVSETSSWIEWGWSAALSAIYLAVIVMLVVWLAPRKRTSRKPFAMLVRFALVFNILTFAVLLQWVVRRWRLPSFRLAGVLIIISLAMMLLYRYLWPAKEAFEEALKKQQSPYGGSFDPTKPQGGKGEHD